MTNGGWITMILSVGFVTTLFLFCIIWVLRGPGRNTEHELGHIEPIVKDKINER